VVKRREAAVSLAFVAAILLSGWTLGAAACDRPAVATPSDRASNLKLEQLLLKHRPRLVVPKIATERSAH